jgi:hypothetical protein
MSSDVENSGSDPGDEQGLSTGEPATENPAEGSEPGRGMRDPDRAVQGASDTAALWSPGPRDGGVRSESTFMTVIGYTGQA